MVLQPWLVALIKVIVYILPCFAPSLSMGYTEYWNFPSHHFVGIRHSTDEKFAGCLKVTCGRVDSKVERFGKKEEQQEYWAQRTNTSG